MLLLIAAIASALLTRGLREEHYAQRLVQSASEEIALESAFWHVAYDLLAENGDSIWAQHATSSIVSVAESQVHVRIAYESGRLDVNLASPVALAAVLRGAGVQGRGDLEAAIADVRRQGDRPPFQSVRQFLRAVDVPLLEIPCVAHYFSVSANLLEPIAVYSPEPMAAWLNEKPGEPPALKPDEIRVARILFRARFQLIGSKANRILEIVFRPVGGTQRPVWIYSWNWVSSPGGECKS